MIHTCSVKVKEKTMAVTLTNMEPDGTCYIHG